MNPPRPPSDCCLVVLTDALYLPGTLTLLRSFFTSNPKLPVILLTDDPQLPADPGLNSFAIQPRLIAPVDYREIRPYKKRKSQRHARTFFKFEAFADFGYQRNIFLDSDILCLQTAPLLFAHSPSPLSAARDSGFRKTRSYKGSPDEINSGVLLIDRPLQGKKTIQRLKSIATDSPGRGGYDAADQGIINKWIRADNIPLNLLPEDYNLIKKDYSDTDKTDTARLLHFCGPKPWFKDLSNSDQPLLHLWRNA